MHSSSSTTRHGAIPGRPCPKHRWKSATRHRSRNRYETPWHVSVHRHARRLDDRHPLVDFATHQFSSAHARLLFLARQIGAQLEETLTRNVVLEGGSAGGVELIDDRASCALRCEKHVPTGGLEFRRALLYRRR